MRNDYYDRTRWSGDVLFGWDWFGIVRIRFGWDMDESRYTVFLLMLSPWWAIGLHVPRRLLAALKGGKDDGRD